MRRYLNSFRLSNGCKKIFENPILVIHHLYHFSHFLSLAVLDSAKDCFLSVQLSQRGATCQGLSVCSRSPCQTQHPAKRISLSRQSSGTVQSEKLHAGQCFSLNFLRVVCLSPESHPMLRLLPMDWNWCLVLFMKELFFRLFSHFLDRICLPKLRSVAVSQD